MNGNNNTLIAFKNCSPFTTCSTHLNDEHVETAENLDIVMNMYSLIEYSDNYADRSGSLFQHKRDEQNLSNARSIDNVNANDSSSFKYKSNLLKGLTTRDLATNTNPDIANTHRLFLNAKAVVSLKCIYSFFRSLEFPLVNIKFYLKLDWARTSVML